MGFKHYYMPSLTHMGQTIKFYSKQVPTNFTWPKFLLVIEKASSQGAMTVLIRSQQAPTHRSNSHTPQHFVEGSNFLASLQRQWCSGARTGSIDVITVDLSGPFPSECIQPHTNCWLMLMKQLLLPPGL